MNNPTIETNIGEILKDLQSGQKKILEEISEIKTDVAVLKANQDNMRETIKDVKDKQDKLIGDVADLSMSQISCYSYCSGGDNKRYNFTDQGNSN